MQKLLVMPFILSLSLGACALDPNDDESVAESNVRVLPALSIARVGDGTVQSSDGAIQCGTICSSGYKSNSTVTLTATPGPSSRFVGWQGGGCSGTGSCTVKIKSDTTITATFAAQPGLWVYKAGNGMGAVFIPPDVGCSPQATACGTTIAYGTTLTITATPSDGSTFDGWSGGPCAGTSLTCTFTVTSDLSTTATFNQSLITECNDGIDNDGDGVADYHGDPGCDTTLDTSEHSDALPCDDGLDNDGDGLIDYPADPSCGTWFGSES